MRFHLILSTNETPDAAVKLSVLGSVDKRIDTAVGEDQHHREVVEPARPEENPSRGKMDSEV